MCNYNPELANQTKTYYDLNKRMMIHEAAEDIDFGEEIYVNYHSLEPESTLFYYGFTTSNLKSVGKDLHFILKQSDLFYQDKSKLMLNNFKKLLKEKDHIVIEFRRYDINKLNKIYFQVLRLLLYNQPFDLLFNKFINLKLDSVIELSKYPIFFISVENEIDVFNFIIESFKKELEGFHPFWNTKYDKDKLSINERNIEYIVRLEKELCSELIEMALSGIEFIKSNFTLGIGPKYTGEFSYFYDELKGNMKFSTNK